MGLAKKFIWIFLWAVTEKPNEPFGQSNIFVGQSPGRIQLFATLWSAARQASLSFTVSWILLTLVCIELMMPSNPFIFCRPFLLLPSIFPSIMSAFHIIWWPKYWCFSFSISPSNEYSGSMSFRIDWFDFLVGQGTPKSLLQHHSLKAPVLQRSAFFMVQLSCPFMTVGKTILAFPLWLQSPSTVMPGCIAHKYFGHLLFYN